MIGDKLIIKPEHRKTAFEIVELIFEKVKGSPGRYAMTVAGESGSGKSETAQALTDEFSKRGISSVIFQQDDYFVYPPKTNHRTRLKDISWVGVQEVKLNLMDKHLGAAVSGANEITKPLVIYQEDKIMEETLSLGNAKVVIAEGTYTTTLQNIHTRIFIDLTYKETKKSRLERAREEQDDFLEKVLFIEHKIISEHKKMADIIITPEYEITL